MSGGFNEKLKRLPKSAYAFLDDLLVECPRCGKLAHVLLATPYYSAAPRLACGGCGLSQTSDSRTLRYLSFYEGLDPFFGLNLWLREPVGREVIWAFNWRHFDDLEFFLAGDWRKDRTNLDLPGYSTNWSYRTRYPQWMHETANRTALLRAMTRIKRRRR